ncbi:MAG: filamentous hemagglutinin N-terminal domain-containing protein [Pseudomonadales bacterium]|nr:filamentous hemagglutinin N-terminal domain-containing protein [Pseudomonadales bacterium]
MKILNLSKQHRNISSPVSTCGYRPTSLAQAIMLATLCVAHPQFSQAAPAGGDIIAGSGSIDTTGNQTVIQQHDMKMAIDWDSFDISADEQVRFIQPNTNAVALNRIADNKQSLILGQLDANGHLFLINSRGIVFGKNAIVNVQGLVASSLDISVDDFMANDHIEGYSFEAVNGIQGMVINRGAINAAAGGSVTLLGQVIVNEGQINAELGSIALASGTKAIVSFDANGSLGLQVPGELLDNTLGSKEAIRNSGILRAEGGQVLIQGNIAADLFTHAINNTGIIEADTLMERDGVIVLSSNNGLIENSGKLQAHGGNITLFGEDIDITGTLDISATVEAGSIRIEADDFARIQGQSLLDASSSEDSGGKIEIFADRVALIDQARIKATGATGGGTVLLGGDVHGTGAHTAQTTVVSQQTHIDASATDEGHGGKVVVWADGSTHFTGDIKADAGLNAGDGGFVEVSGKQTLHFNGQVTTAAPNGKLGSLLLDPDTITIINGGSAADDSEVADGNITNGGAFDNDNFTISEQALENLAADTNIRLEAKESIIIQSLTDDGVLDLNQNGSVVFSVGDRLTLDTLVFSMDQNDTILMSGDADLLIEMRYGRPSNPLTVTLGNIVSQGSGNITINVNDNNANANQFISINTRNISNNSGNITLYGEVQQNSEGVAIVTGDLNIIGNGNINITADATTNGAVDQATIDTGNLSIGGNGNINLLAHVDSPSDPGPSWINTKAVSIAGDGSVDLNSISDGQTSGDNSAVWVDGDIDLGGTGNVSLKSSSVRGTGNTKNSHITVGNIRLQQGDILLETRSEDSTGDARITLNGSTYSTAGFGTAAGQGKITIQDRDSGSTPLLIFNNNSNIDTTDGGNSTGSTIDIDANFRIEGNNSNLALYYIGAAPRPLNTSDTNGGSFFNSVTHNDYNNSVNLGDDVLSAADITYDAATLLLMASGNSQLNFFAKDSVTTGNASLSGVDININADIDDNNSGTFIAFTGTNFAINDGNLTVRSQDIQLDGALTTTTGNINLIANNNINLTGSGSANSSAGLITFDAINDIILANSSFINSTGGAINLSANNDLLLQGSSFINSAGGNIDLTADADNSNDGGAITMAAATSINAGAGTLNLAAYNNITLTGLSTSNNTSTALRISSESGSLLDGDDDGSLDISASNGTVILSAISAGQSIGTLLNPLEISANNIVFNNSNGDTALNVTGAINLAALLSSGNLFINSTGDITTSGNISSAGITLTSANDITIGNTLNSGSGAIDLNAINSIILNTDGQLTSSSGDISLSATNSAIELKGNALIDSSDGDITLTASNANIDMQAVSAINAGNGIIKLMALTNVIIANLTADGNIDTAISIISNTGLIQHATGATGTDISAIAGNINLSAVTGLGASGEQLSVDTSNLIVALTVATGDIALANNGGNISLNNLVTSGGNIDINASGDISVNNSSSGIQTTLAGATIDINSSAGQLIINDTIDSNNGDISLLAGSDILINSDTTISSSGGHIQLTSSNGAISMADDTAVNSGNGSINVQALDHITITGLISANSSDQAIVILSSLGSIFDADPASQQPQDIDIDAALGGVLLTTQAPEQSIGTQDNALEITARHLSANTNNGNINIHSVGDMQINDINSGGGDVTLSADATLDITSLNNINHLQIDAAQTILRNGVDAGSITQVGNIAIEADISTVQGDIILDNVTLSNGSTLDAAANIIIESLTINDANNVQLINRNDANIQIDELNSNAAADILISSSGSLTLGNSAIDAATLTAQVDNNDNGLETMTLADISAKRVVLSGSATGDDHLFLNGALNSKDISINNFANFSKPTIGDLLDLNQQINASIQEIKSNQQAGEEGYFESALRISYLDENCANDDNRNTAKCRKKQSMMDFLGTFLIDNQIPDY